MFLSLLAVLSFVQDPHKTRPLAVALALQIPLHLILFCRIRLFRRAFSWLSVSLPVPLTAEARPFVLSM